MHKKQMLLLTLALTSLITVESPVQAHGGGGWGWGVGAGVLGASMIAASNRPQVVVVDRSGQPVEEHHHHHHHYYNDSQDE